MLDECVLGVRANVFTTNELKGKGDHKEQSGLSATSGHRVLPNGVASFGVR